MRSRKAILLGSILALVLSGAGNASVRAAETESSSAYISNETAEAIEEADRIGALDLDLSGLYSVAGSTVIAGIGITSEFDFSEDGTKTSETSQKTETEAKTTEAGKTSGSSTGTSGKTGTTGSSKTTETEKKTAETAETSKTTETEKKTTETSKATETEKKTVETNKTIETEKKTAETSKTPETEKQVTETKADETSAPETTTPEAKGAAESKPSAASTQPVVSEIEKPKTIETEKETEQVSENTAAEDLQAEPAVTGDETDLVPFLLLGAAAGLLLVGDLIMKRKAD